MGPSPSIGVVVHPTKVVEGSLRTLHEWAERRGVRLLARDDEAGRLPPSVPIETVPDEAFLARVDALVSLGGDGTMLGAMRLVLARPVPVLGVNYGNVGFLVEVNPADLGHVLDRLPDGEFVVEPYACVEVEADGAVATAFNDVVLGAAEAGGSVELDLEVEGVQFGYYRCDALVLSTPTGSTAYNYAAGGPVISPSADVLAMTPVAPMTGISHSIVLPATDTVGIRNAAPGREAVLRVDGNAWAALRPSASIAARLRPEAGQVVRIDPAGHARRSRLKLSLLDLPLRPGQIAELLPDEVRDEVRRLRGRLEG
ncbi:NAD(+)/NADH kinase [Actinomycetospora termitidis]|uniref:NAD kinase n=1 Tax=Actinomycetospora termitidis TaxID=3053470 RepID=A0ABT7M678_9PSEU|nr:NAD(+)/NADH kinase [Actinomycetospora sp. Odt1-22]MDL5156171.1 NAD(+)/NADH kinase [Actinomycetospora sp. Odt1-22]